MKAFFGMAAASGLGLDTAFNGLRDVFQTPGSNAEQQRLQQGVQQGTSRPDEERALGKLQQQDIGQLKGIAVPAAAALAGAGAAQSQGLQGILSQLTGGQGAQGEQPQEQPQEEPGRKQSFFERAMEGLSFFDLPDTARDAVGPIMRKLDTLEAQNVPWEDKVVQRLANQARNMASEPTMAGQEDVRFQEEYGQPQQQAAGGQAQLMQQMQALIGALRG
ncbi:MAG: hypothetical protein ACXABY_07255 [Candidatus Thorarchaeota archaeon]